MSNCCYENVGQPPRLSGVGCALRPIIAGCDARPPLVPDLGLETHLAAKLSLAKWCVKHTPAAEGGGAKLFVLYGWAHGH
jgi:hypothetical protein